MQKPIHRRTSRSLWLSLVVTVLLQTGCTRTAPPEDDFSVGIADSASIEGKALTLHNLRLVSDGFLISKNFPPEKELEGKVFFQIVGLKRATQASEQLATGLKLAGAPKDSAEAKAFRERYFSLSADEYTLTQFSPQGEPTDIPTVDIDLIILD